MSIKNKGIFAFVAGYHLLLLVLLPFVLGQFTWGAFAVFFISFVISGISITAGYHRLFSHRTYKAKPVYEWACLLGSTLAIQASALRWSNDHRLHHSHIDTDRDPYSIKKGFWYAHIWWLFTFEKEINTRLVSDLLKNPRVVFQDKHYAILTLLVNGAVFGIGCLFMSPLASLVYGVLLRVFAIHHCTWFINSLAHVWGSKTYAKELSAADNAFLAFLTFGEGYHNYHHAIANDYRNGVKWYHFDPTKWLIWTASKVGLASDLRSMNSIKVQQALVNKDKEMFLDRIKSELDETSAELRIKIDELAKSFEEKASALMTKLKQLKEATDEQRKLLNIEIRQLRKELRAQWRAWVSLSEFTLDRYGIVHP